MKTPHWFPKLWVRIFPLLQSMIPWATDKFFSMAANCCSSLKKAMNIFSPYVEEPLVHSSSASLWTDDIIQIIYQSSFTSQENVSLFTSSLHTNMVLVQRQEYKPKPMQSQQTNHITSHQTMTVVSTKLTWIFPFSNFVAAIPYLWVQTDGSQLRWRSLRGQEVYTVSAATSCPRCRRIYHRIRRTLCRHLDSKLRVVNSAKI